MKLTFTIIVLHALTICALFGDDQSAIPNASWEKHPDQGISVALALVNRTEFGRQNAINVFVKNDSNQVKYLPANFNDHAIHILYVGSDGKSIPLRNYDEQVPSAIEGAPTQNQLWPFKPGETIKRTIELTPAELVIVKEYPVVCEFYVSDKEYGGRQLIKSSPRQLTEPTEK